MIKAGVTRAILMVNGHRCQYCGKPAKEADHIVPVVHGGIDGAKNLTASCRRCNAIKGARRLKPEHERELLTRAWIHAGFVEQMVETYTSAVKRALRG